MLSNSSAWGVPRVEDPMGWLLLYLLPWHGESHCFHCWEWLCCLAAVHRGCHCYLHCCDMIRAGCSTAVRVAVVVLRAVVVNTSIGELGGVGWARLAGRCCTSHIWGDVDTALQRFKISQIARITPRMILPFIYSDKYGSHLQVLLNLLICWI